MDDALARLRLALLAVEREQVAAQEDLAVEVLLERAQDRVLAARQLGGDFVGKLDLRPHPCSAARTIPDTRLPSARPSTAAIACFIAAPMSFGEAAPLSRTACSTIAESSCSESSAGRYDSMIAASASSPAARSSRPPSGRRLPPRDGACARAAAPRARPRRPPWRPSAARRAPAAGRRPFPFRLRASHPAGRLGSARVSPSAVQDTPVAAVSRLPRRRSSRRRPRCAASPRPADPPHRGGPAPCSPRRRRRIR